MTQRQAYIVGVARRWIGTPYRHQASALGRGCDCLGLVRGVWREAVGDEPEHPPSYTPDWSEASGDERLWRAAMRNLVKVEIDFECQGNIVLFRMAQGYVAKHLGFLAQSGAGYPTIIHAYSGRGVVETPLTQAWQRKVVAQFKFPKRSA